MFGGGGAPGLPQGSSGQKVPCAPDGNGPSKVARIMEIRNREQGRGREIRGRRGGRKKARMMKNRGGEEGGQEWKHSMARGFSTEIFSGC